MNFRKKRTGTSWDNNYYWIASKQGHTLTVEYNDKFSSYALSVEKDDTEVFSSLWNGITLKTPDEAFMFAEEWVAKNLTGRTWRRNKISRDKKVEMLLQAIDEAYIKYPTNEGVIKIKSAVTQYFQ